MQWSFEAVQHCLDFSCISKGSNRPSISEFGRKPNVEAEQFKCYGEIANESPKQILQCSRSLYENILMSHLINISEIILIEIKSIRMLFFKIWRLELRVFFILNGNLICHWSGFNDFWQKVFYIFLYLCYSFCILLYEWMHSNFVVLLPWAAKILHSSWWAWYQWFTVF